MPKIVRFVFIGFLFTALFWWSTHHAQIRPQRRPLAAAAGQPNIPDFASAITNDTSAFMGAKENATCRALEHT